MNFKRALIIKKEWLDKILDGSKVWEMRATKTKINERIGLIESGTGLIMGEVDLFGCSPNPVKLDKGLIRYHHVEDLALLKKWKYAWYLKNPIKYNNPIPYKHPKGAVIWVKFNE